MTVEPKSIIYCGICGIPPEYCEFGGKFKRCKEWLNESHPELYIQLYSENEQDGVTSQMSSLSLEQREKLDQKIQKEQAKTEAKAERELQKKLASKVTIKRLERGRRKHVISILGLEVFGIDLKKLAKTFSSKFATGTSVTKTLEGKDEVIIQGDVGEEVELIIQDMLKEKGLNDIKVERCEDKIKPVKPKK